MTTTTDQVVDIGDPEEAMSRVLAELGDLRKYAQVTLALAPAGSRAESIAKCYVKHLGRLFEDLDEIGDTV